MKKHLAKIFFLCLTIVSLQRSANGQSFPVMVHVQVVQPVPPYLPQLKADLSGQHYGQLNQDVTHHLSITISSTGNSQVPQHLKLAGSIERVAPSPMGVSLRPDFQPQQAIILNRGQMISLNNDLLQEAFGNFSENALVFNNMDLEALRQNGADFKLPEGTYRVCVTAYDFDRPGFSSPLSAPGTGCAYFTICYTASAPQLILPVSTMMQSNSEFQVFTPHSSQINFAWTPPATTCGIPLGGLTYNLEIRQVFDGQTVTDALQNPYVFHQQFIPTNFFQLDSFRYAHVFIPGQQYIVRIKTNFTPMPGSPLEIANQGYSQIAAFAYSPFSGGYHTESAGANYDTLPTTATTIRGRLAYRFPLDTSGLTFPVKRETVYLQKVYAKTSVDANGITRYTPLTATEQSSLPPYQDMLDGMTTTTDNNGNFQLNCAMTRMDSAGVIPAGKWNMLFTTAYIGNREVIRPGDAGAYPDAGALKGQLTCLYRLISTNPAFKPYGQYLTITPGGVHNVSDLVVDADSYTLDVNVQEVFNNVKGNRVAGAEIRIFRLTADKKNPHLDIPLNEGDLLDSSRDWHESGDKVLIAERVTPTPATGTTDSNAYTVHFPRLFRNPGTTSYDYLVCLVKGGVIMGQASYSSLMMSDTKSGNPDPGNKKWTLFFDEADALYGKRTGVQPNTDTSNGPTQPTGVTDAWSTWAYGKAGDTAHLSLQKTLVAAPHSQVTGTLQYTYKNDAATPARPYANQPVKLMVYYLFKGQSQHGFTMSVSRSAVPVFYQQAAMNYANQDGIVVNPDPHSGTALFGSGGQITDNGSVLQTVNTDAEGRFRFDFENADSTMQTMQGSMDTGLKPGQFTAGSAATGQFTRVYRVVPANGYYCAPDDNVAVQPWGSFDCGTLTSFVHTYTMNVVIVNQDRTPQINAPVNLCRYTNDRYANLLPGTPAGGTFLNREVSLTQVDPTAVPPTAGNGGNSRFLPVSFTLPVNNLVSLSNQAIVRQTGMTDGNGSIVFRGVTACIDGENDTWIVEADGNATQRTGTITFQTKFQAIPKDFYFSGPSAYFSGVVGENPANAAFQATNYFSFPGYADPSQVTFNSELQPGKTFYDTLQVVLSPPRYAGRVIDGFSTLGIPNATVSLSHKNYSLFYTKGHVYAEVSSFDATTDPNGYYDDTRYSVFYAATPPESGPDLLSVFAPGYEQVAIDLTQALSPGQQDYRDPIVLKPLATNVFGYVADAEHPDPPVTARVKAKINGRWVDTYSYSGDADKPSPADNYLVGMGTYQQMLTQGLTSNVTSLQPVSTAGSGPRNPAPQKQLQMRKQNSSGGTSQVSQSNGPGVHTFGGISIDRNISGEITAINIDPKKPNPGNWVSVSPSYRGISTKYGHDQVSGVQRFDIDLPAIADSIIIMPYDPAYLTQSFLVNPKGPGENLGVFLLTPRKHIVNVKVQIGDGRPAIGAMVSIDGVKDTIVVDQTGIAHFEFVNNATNNFMLRVRPNDRLQKEDVPGMAIFGDTSIAFNNNDIGDTNISVRVHASRVVTGTVRFAGSGKPVSGAAVYPDEGAGYDADATTTTGSDGKFRLVGISSLATRLRASYTSPGSTYTGDVQPLPGSGVPATVNLTIGEISGIDISRLFGFTARLDKAVKNTDNSYSIDGQLVNLPANADFAVRSDIPQPALSFHQLKVKASAIKNAAGIPAAVPVQDSISLDAHFVSSTAFAVFDTEMSAPDDGLLSVRKTDNDTSGSLTGKVRITDNSFNFPSSYLSISQSVFFLGNYGAPAGEGKLLLPLFTSVPGKMQLNKYSIGAAGGAPIQFRYLGFPGISETTGTRESFVMGDSINLFMNLQAKIQDNISLSFSSGSAIIHHNGLGRTITNDSVSFNLENWRVASGSWELSPSSGGIWLKKGTLYTGKVDLPFTDLRIFAGDPAGELTCSSLTSASVQTAASNGLFTVGGGASQLKIYNGTQVIFVYDPDAGATPGQGHFKFSLTSPTGKAAYFGGLDGMSVPGQRFNIQFLSELSDGEELFAFDPKSGPVTFYNQVQFSPQNLFSYPDRIVLGGGVSLGIPGVPDNLTGTFTFTHVSGSDGKTNQLGISPLNIQFTGNGGTRFTSSGAPGTQLFSKFGVGISGDLTVTGLASPVHSQLVSMITSGANDLNAAHGNADQASATPVRMSGTGVGGYTSPLFISPAPSVPGPIKQQAEVILGDALSEGNAFADQAMDQVTGPVKDARNQLMNQLDQAENSLLQSIPVGAMGQEISGLAGKWRLAGEGLDAIKDFNGNPAGSMLRMNGVIKGFTGIDVDSAVENKLKMIANEQLSGLKDQLPVDQITSAANSSTFAGMHFDFDLQKGSITGSLTMPRLDFGAVLLTNIGIEMLMDRQGWYFYTGAGLDLPQAYPLHPLLFPIQVGIIIGDYPSISPALVSRITTNSYFHKLPKTYDQGIHGLFITGLKELLPPTSLDINLELLDFEIGASGGLDARMYANFGDKSQDIGIAGMEFANVFAKLSVAGGICGVKGNADLNLGMKTSFSNKPDGVTVKAAACASVSVTGSAWCGPESVDYSKSVIGLLTLCGGADCKKAIDFSISLDGGTCSDSNQFDY